MKTDLLRLLQSGNYVSGEEMSTSLGVSRTAIWKQLNTLREQGYEIQSAPRKGYKLISAPNTIFPHDVQAFLNTKRLGKQIYYYETVSSTQPLAHEFAAKNEEEGIVVLANQQEGGRGRLGRQWQAKAGDSISMTLLLRPEIDIQKAPQLTLLAAVAVTRAIEKVSGLSCDIKWPNDILFNGKKLVGILTEMAADPDSLKYVIVGIGINCNQSAREFSNELEDVATSIRIETARPVSRAQLVAEVLNEFEWLYEQYIEKGFTTIKPLWEAHAISIHTFLFARMPQKTVYGYAHGITDDGLLCLEDKNGKEHLIYSADIELDTSP
ncbi:biotin--[acetyl-CoA-carboxylase] ligase [Shouchella patagoniensis]|uniref:biotin--[acetyl-CoA-carboxylase] ligase n=1 Tax=Shouchella patagoniensis TaxID=228576 RepID=UPI000994B9D7|nr:biotin--[acetyl-CoA-carboxylase] ligase [Shouchella patagoniensis]